MAMVQRPFLRVELSCPVDYFRDTDPVPEVGHTFSEENKKYWDDFMRDVNADLGRIGGFHSESTTDKFVMLSSCPKKFVHVMDSTISCSKLKSSSDWKIKDFVNRKFAEETISVGGEDERCDTLKPYFCLNHQLCKASPFLKSSVGVKQRFAVKLKENGWTHRLCWCLNKLYQPKYAFDLCFDDDWAQVPHDRLMEVKWYVFTGTRDLVVMSSNQTDDSGSGAKRRQC
jgi:hypothetical protein